MLLVIAWSLQTAPNNSMPLSIWSGSRKLTDSLKEDWPQFFSSPTTSKFEPLARMTLYFCAKALPISLAL